MERREDGLEIGPQTLEIGFRGETLEEPLYEAELSAIESALDKIYFQRATLTGDLEHIRQRMLSALEEGAGEVLPVQKGVV